MTMRRALFAAAPLNTDLIVHRGIPPLPGFGWDGRPAWPFLGTQAAGEGGTGTGGTAGTGGTGQAGQQGGTGAGAGQQGGTGQQGGQGGAQFVAPQDQAEFDRMVGERLARERAKYADYDQLKTKAAEHDKTVEAQKTEAQKLADRATAAEAKATKAEREALVGQVALEKGLTASQAKRLVGNTKDELIADADELLKDLGKAGGGNQTGGQSTSFDNGARQTANTPKGAAGLDEARKRFPEKYATKT